jgi:hypothetical protein
MSTDPFHVEDLNMENEIQDTEIKTPEDIQPTMEVQHISKRFPGGGLDDVSLQFFPARSLPSWARTRANRPDEDHVSRIHRMPGRCT